MRLWILSDLHLECSLWTLPNPLPDFDILVAAGDIHVPARAGIQWFADHVAFHPVIYVPGNHEWYAPGGDRTLASELKCARTLADQTNVHFLLNTTSIIGDVRFLGTTLWTDYALQGTPEISMAHAETGMPDHYLILPEDRRRPLTADQARYWHHSACNWIESECRKPANGRWQRTVVVTHHAPHRGSIAPAWSGHPLTPAFCSDLEDLLRNADIDLWVHGHTHDTFDYHVGKTRIVCNPKGYGPKHPGGPVENPAFDPGFIIDI